MKLHMGHTMYRISGESKKYSFFGKQSTSRNCLNLSFEIYATLLECKANDGFCPNSNCVFKAAISD